MLIKMVNEFCIFIYKKPKQVFLIHGEEESQEVLKDN